MIGEAITFKEKTAVECSGAPTRNWFALNNNFPDGSGQFHLYGEIQAVNPGILAVLTPRLPGINPRILLLDLHLLQRPGIWVQTVTWVKTGFGRDIPNPPYNQVQVFCGGKRIADFPVEDIP